MATEPNAKAKAWELFDRIVARAADNGLHSNPWLMGLDGELRYEPDYTTLAQLLGVPLYLKADTRTGVPALALDVWLSYELRRAGFGRDQVWPRPIHPRILPASVANLLKALTAKERAPVEARITQEAAVKNVTAASANILGKNYLKQVDVIITDWATGPELLISTKRMDSSYGKNAANRVEESYGDAKNLRLRHPLAALGFMFGLRSDILQKEPATAEWLFDLLAKLGREDDAYHATCVVLMEYSDAAAILDSGEETPPAAIPEPGPELREEEIAPAHDPDYVVESALLQLPKVMILQDKIPKELAPGRFLAAMVDRVLGATPVNMHAEARKRRRESRNALD
ncbi:hypothetical protein [Variovorax paradoxus]|uniref:hypothetical protein n=1 Tax=Variovorax paradoxus TaxID=34073 RepID=UPI00278A4D39|nr:hypothetical protein [Variovorax paradoxus]MDP9932524.1 hypothetical protein [Variovorax paradoxus]